MASKVVVIGSVNGQLSAVFTKLAKLQPKQNFSFAIIVGDLFGDCSTEAELNEITGLLQGNTVVPLPTYFTVGNRPLPTRVIEKIQADDEVCPNLFFLGKRGTLKTTEGVRIVALGGTFEEKAERAPESNAVGKFQSTYSEADARALFGLHRTDILITNQWPKDVKLGSSQTFTGDESGVPSELQCIADVCGTLKPRYHFSRSDTGFFEREPFFYMPTEEGDGYQTTRFISLPSYGSRKDALYAFNLDPSVAPPISIPIGCTICPWSAVQSKRKDLPSQRESYQRFSQTDGERDPEHRRRHKKSRAPPPGPEQCFFCLSNPNIATQLITSIGNDSYITTAKGPLPKPDFFPSLGFPGHMLIIPFEHSPTIDLIFDPKTRASTYTEMQKYRESLHQMLNEKSGGKLGAVTWEISRSGGIHTHWQFLPMPVEKIRGRLVEAAFQAEAANLKYEKFKTIPGPDEIDNHGMNDFFRAFIWTPSRSEEDPGEGEGEGDMWSKPGHKGVYKTPSGEEKITMLPIQPQNRFDLQFGRRVMGKLLLLDERLDWRDCTQTEDEETKDAEAFKEAFKKHDFTMDMEE
ncbi:hypothetical protein N7522_012380 [Penicillium canescens]|uniref:uncharacterized protein n=1 Tax=Penicillium canescens TaxID=5083 RepID=UPI0026DF01D5|nr:uncharacterized protein N7446_013574 [Penicillium canescens]KAJ5985184.1 hypothetical protein N7522_012380 [Penicillium canescens]KAJ6025517.1 hypothetical protein N7444_013196 [Penicillium canescens]KAJ6042508.1 hypothetical protein N7446_013574 [Penicillium canescens]